MEHDLKEATRKFMKGHWLSHDKTVSLTICEQELKIRLGAEDAENAYSAEGDWWGSYFVFKDLPRFFVLYANESEMKFGELRMPNDVNGMHKWAAKFYRMS